MPKTVEKIIKEARSWIGVKEGSAKHKEIIDTYNDYEPLAHGYEMKYTDAWCAVFVSFLSIKCGYTSIIPTDCRCSSLITKFKKLGVYKENENRTPSVGDIVFYDWEDSGNGDNKGTPNHVGIVSAVKGDYFTVIEGNKDNKVGTRKMEVNGKYLRGFACPKYEKEADVEPVSSYYIHTVVKGDTLYKLALDYKTTISEIMKVNADLISNRNLIRTGWELKIPKKG